jgi:pyruvate,water dikinase
MQNSTIASSDGKPSPADFLRQPAAASPCIRWFDAIALDDVTEVGGKGVNLEELSRAGLPVPPGFVLGVSVNADAIGAARATSARAERKVLLEANRGR